MRQTDRQFCSKACHGKTKPRREDQKRVNAIFEGGKDWHMQGLEAVRLKPSRPCSTCRRAYHPVVESQEWCLPCYAPWSRARLSRGRSKRGS